ncbi:MAG: DMT family transporter [Rhodospirillaceae bacterium]
MTRLRADLLLLLAATIWGTAFVAQKWANGTMGPIAFVAVRFLLSALFEARRAPRPLTRSDLGLAGLIGLTLLSGAVLQQAALVTASATNGGFLTALYVVLVPFTAWMISREPIRPLVIAACLICVAGAWLLTDTGAARTFATGDLLLIASDVPWAFGIALVAVFQRRNPRPLFLSFAQYCITALGAGVLALIFEEVSWAAIVASGPSILYAGIISGGIAFTLQIIAQRHTPPAEAGLIMSLESVFAALAGAWLLAERLTPVAMGGCVLILAGVVMVEAGPALTRGLKAMLGRVR